MIENRQYRELLAAAAVRLEGREPEDIARKANVRWDAGSRTFSFETLGRPIRVHWPDGAVDTPLEMWHHLVALQYLTEADGSPLTESQISLREFRAGGLIRGGSFDRENDRFVQKKLGRLRVEALTAAAVRLNGVPTAGKADFAAVFSFLPNFPLELRLWLADEEFPAACKVLCNGAAEHYLKVEAAGTAAGILLRQLEEAADA